MKAIDIGLFLRRTSVHEEEFIATQTDLRCRENGWVAQCSVRVVPSDAFKILRQVVLGAALAD
jgi:hypothetical protein